MVESDGFEHSGWSVVVTGKLREEEAPDDGLRLRPWARAEKPYFVVLSVDGLSGRRLSMEGER